MRKLKILFPTGSFYPAQTGGPDNTVYWITKALTRQGHQAVISTTARGLPITTPRGRWLNTEYGRVIYNPTPIHYLPTTLVMRAVRELRTADVLHLSMITYPASLMMAAINSRFYRKPMLWSSRGDLDPHMMERSPRKKAAVVKLIDKMVDKELLWFHSTCDAETEYITNNFGEGTRVIQIPNYMELPEKIETKKEKYFLYIGRIDAKKAIENLIEALSRSPSFLDSEFTLKIVGDYYNAYGRGLVKQVEDLKLTHKIRFLGHRDGREKEELLAAAWFTFMPSHTENFGIVVMEGLAQGTPAVASTGTPWKILEEHNAGYWIDNDPENLIRTIERIYDLSPEQLSSMNGNALRLAQEKFGIHANVGEWEEAYKKLTHA